MTDTANNLSSSATEHSLYDRDSTHALTPLHWPDQQPLAVCFVVCAEYYDMYAPFDAIVPANSPGGMGRGPYPDFRTYSMREYGNRVGVFRLLKLFARYGIKATLAVDAKVAESRPAVVAAAARHSWAFVGHGESSTNIITSQMSDATEKAYIARALQAIRSHAGSVIGWHGPEYSQSARTPSLLANEGVRYMLDWPLDECVVPMRTDTGSILALPMSADLDSLMAHWYRKISMRRWVASVVDAVETLAAPGQSSGKLLIINLHAWLMGQPYRVSYLQELLDYLSGRTDLWIATTDEVAIVAEATLNRA